jgi:hypothetical protein
LIAGGPAKAQQLEIGHILFVDIVSYSRLPTNRQRSVLEELVDKVESSRLYVRSLSNEQLVRIPTGDGMALVFIGDPTSPAKLALELDRALKESDFEVRMSLHTGPFMRMVDIGMHTNVAGGGINNAKRVLDLAGPRQILCSGDYARLLGELEEWQEKLHFVGRSVVKHGFEIDIFNLAGPDFGSTEAPVLNQAVVDISARAAPNAAKPRTVTLLYRRNVSPDDHVLRILEDRLIEYGHTVFIDRHLKIGVQWASEINKRIREADAVIPLISMESLNSEMMVQEIETAYRAAKKTGGKPLLLPIRVAYEGALTNSVAPFLTGIQYFLWEDEKDDGPMLNEIAEALDSLESLNGNEMDNEGARVADLPAMAKESGGGAVPIGSKFYIERTSDVQFLEAVDQKQSIVLAKGARQMGKTSLLVRAIDRAVDKGWQVARTDFQKLGDEDLQSSETVYKALANSLWMELDLDGDPDETWMPSKSPALNFERYLRKHVFPAVGEHFLWSLDEADRLLTASCGGEVFALFRSWHNERATNPTGPWSKLTLAFAYATEAHLFIKDLNQSPFNVGVHLTLQDFDLNQVAELNGRYGEPVKGEDLLRVQRLLGGHPFLTRKCLYLIAAEQTSLDEFEKVVVSDDGPVGDHLKRMLFLLARDPELTEDLKEILAGRQCPSEESFYRLRSAGVILGDSPRNPRLRCDVYKRFLSRHLL